MRGIKKIVIYGDSISTGTHGEGAYLHQLQEKFGAEIVNYAVGSSGISYATPGNTATILEDENNIPRDADLVLMWHGSNEWYWGSPIGTLSDQTAHTYLGAIAQAVTRIRKRAPEAELVWLTPIYRYEKPDQGAYAGGAYETPNKIGLTLYDYYRALEAASIRHGFPLIDIRRGCGIHEGNQERYLEDRVHPNKAGYARIWRVLERGLAEILQGDEGCS